MNDSIGFIGLGIMGRPMALNLIRAGYRLVVHARREESLQPLLDVGATAGRSPADVASRAATVVTMVADTPDVEQLMLGPDGIVDGIAPGSIVIDMSTISPSSTRTIAERLAERGAAMLDAPVSGGEQGAIDGTLSIMVGGPGEAFDRVRPLLDLLGGNVVHVGDNGAGQVCKACNQIVVGHTIAGVGEAFVLAEAAGVDPAKVREALMGGFANSRILEVHGRRMLEADYAPGFRSELHQKDMRIVLEAAYELGIALPGAAQIAQYLNALVGQGLADLDSSAIYRAQCALSGGGEAGAWAESED
jgi:2-hydroxy-3-oxopropionate reductase